MIPTFFTALALGTITAITPLILALTAWIPGSGIFQGNIFFDTTANAFPGIFVNTLARAKTGPVTCTATGGLTGVYETCSVTAAAVGLTTTGTLLGVTLECGNVAKPLTGDVSFKKAAHAATGSALTNLADVTLGSGANVPSIFAVPPSWNPTDLLTFSTRVTPSGALTNARYDCQMWPILLDKYGS